MAKNLLSQGLDFKMRWILILPLFFLGCSKTVYINPLQSVEISAKPIPEKYEVQKIKINGEEGYFIKDSESSKMARNWLNYKEWCETNYDFMISLKNEF